MLSPISIYVSLIYLSRYRVIVCVCVCVCVCVFLRVSAHTQLKHVHGLQNKSCGSLSFPYTMWFVQIEITV